jgi:hypothetical protein
VEQRKRKKSKEFRKRNVYELSPFLGKIVFLLRSRPIQQDQKNVQTTFLRSLSFRIFPKERNGLFKKIENNANQLKCMED